MTTIDWLIFIACAGLLSLERISYWWVWRHPVRFRHLCKQGILPDANNPVEQVYLMFLVFKLVQLSVFIGWCMWFGQTWLPLPVAPLAILLMGAFVLISGQLLNFSVFWTLGKTGVFYGNRFGHETGWHQGFPFSLFSHPQYLGTLMSIWGFFFIMRYPEPDWIALPLLETVYYTVGSRLETEEENETANIPD